jgi:hypothetical protein
MGGILSKDKFIDPKPGYHVKILQLNPVGKSATLRVLLAWNKPGATCLIR